MELQNYIFYLRTGAMEYVIKNVQNMLIKIPEYVHNQDV